MSIRDKMKRLLSPSRFRALLHAPRAYKHPPDVLQGRVERMPPRQYKAELIDLLANRDHSRASFLATPEGEYKRLRDLHHSWRYWNGVARSFVLAGMDRLNHLVRMNRAMREKKIGNPTQLAGLDSAHADFQAQIKTLTAALEDIGKDMDFSHGLGHRTIRPQEDEGAPVKRDKAPPVGHQETKAVSEKAEQGQEARREESPNCIRAGVIYRRPKFSEDFQRKLDTGMAVIRNAISEVTRRPV